MQTLEQVTRERFPRRARLSDVQACWDAGRRRRTRLLEVAWRPGHSARARTAIVVPRFRHTAVARNRLRRRLRELLRRGPLATLPPVDLVLRARRPAYDASFAALRAELAACVREIT
ncbi:MAG: ribonuclease P protein component [Gemmatimonadales bacterium]